MEKHAKGMRIAVGRVGVGGRTALGFLNDVFGHRFEGFNRMWENLWVADHAERDILQ